MEQVRFFRRRGVQLVGVAVVALAVGYFAARLVRPSGAPPATSENTVYVQDQGLVNQGFQSMSDIQAAFRQVAQKVLPSVVEIDVVDVVKAPAIDPLSPFQFFFGPNGFGPGGPSPGPESQAQPQAQEFRRQGLGSGVIVKSTGGTAFVLTNNHVAGEAQEINVKLSDGRSFPATLVGKDEKKDLALVSFRSPEPVPVADLGDSDTLQVGDWVLAVGTPLGFHSTVTEGIVSALGRESLPGSGVASFTDYIQTDAAINQGNSGGALVNIDGQVVGISTWIASPSGGNVGLGFAIPINNARKAIDEFISKGKVSYGWLGVSMGSLPEGDASSLYGEAVQGAFVQGVYRGSPASRAGIQPGDTIVSLNGQKVADPTDLLLAVGNLSPGAQAKFDVRRGPQTLGLTATIDERSDDQSLAAQAGQLWPGLSVVLITSEIRAQLGLPRSTGSLIVSSVSQGSPADVAGFKVGDIVRSIDGRPVGSILEFYRAVNKTNPNELMLTVSRQGQDFRVGLVR
jgi:serine protease Do